MTLVALNHENRRKAATLLVAVGPERAAALMKTFDEDEMRQLAAEVAQIGTLPKEEVARDPAGRRGASGLASHGVGRRCALRARSVVPGPG